MTVPNECNSPRHRASDPDSHWMEPRERARSTHFGRRLSPTERRRAEVMRDWYGSTRAREEILAHRKPPEHISTALRGVIRELGLGHNTLLHSVADRWETLFGADVGAKARPVDLNGKTLVVEVTESTWMYVLKTMHLHEMKRRLAEETGNRITDIRLVPAGRTPHRRPDG